MSMRRPHRLILCNDGNAVAGPTREAPLGEQGLVELAIDPLRDTLVDTLYWQLGTDPYFGTPTHRLTDHYSHDTAVGPRWGAGTERFATASQWRVYENTRELIEAGTDPPAVLIEHGHRAGLQVFLSMRVNDVHDRNLPGGLDDALMSPVKRGYRDWILGGDGLRRTACDFAVPAVRGYKLALAEEAIDRYDLDGLDWDFCRVPVFFQPGEVGRGTALMTDLVRRLKAALARKSERAGRPVLFSARVPGSLDGALAAGLDVRTWIERALIDVVVVGHATGSRFRLPVEEYVAAARGTGVEVIAQNLGLFMQPRPRWAGLLFGERDYYSTEMCRAVAAVHHRAGAHGLYLFNNHYLSSHPRRRLRTAAVARDRRPGAHRPPRQALPGRPAGDGRRAAADRPGQPGRPCRVAARCRRRPPRRRTGHAAPVDRAAHRPGRGRHRAERRPARTGPGAAAHPLQRHLAGPGGHRAPASGLERAVRAGDRPQSAHRLPAQSRQRGAAGPVLSARSRRKLTMLPTSGKSLASMGLSVDWEVLAKAKG